MRYEVAINSWNNIANRIGKMIDQFNGRTTSQRALDVYLTTVYQQQIKRLCNTVWYFCYFQEFATRTERRQVVGELKNPTQEVKKQLKKSSRCTNDMHPGGG